MTLYKSLEGVPQEAFCLMRQALRNRASAHLGLSYEELVSRPLRPEDVGASIPCWSFSVKKNRWTNVIPDAYTIPTDTWIGIYGVQYVADIVPAVTQIQIFRKGSYSHIWNIQGIHMTDGVRFFKDVQKKYAAGRTDLRIPKLCCLFSDQIPIIEPMQPLCIEMYSTANRRHEPISLLGTVVEPRGRWVCP